VNINISNQKKKCKCNKDVIPKSGYTDIPESSLMNRDLKADTDGLLNVSNTNELKDFSRNAFCCKIKNKRKEFKK
jgi:hypothetical protein